MAAWYLVQRLGTSLGTRINTWHEACILGPSNIPGPCPHTRTWYQGMLDPYLDPGHHTWTPYRDPGKFVDGYTWFFAIWYPEPTNVYLKVRHVQWCRHRKEKFGCFLLLPLSQIISQLPSIYWSQTDIPGAGYNFKRSNLPAIHRGKGWNSNHKLFAHTLHVLSIIWWLDSYIVHGLEC